MTGNSFFCNFSDNVSYMIRSQNLGHNFKKCLILSIDKWYRGDTQKSLNNLHVLTYHHLEHHINIMRL